PSGSRAFSTRPESSAFALPRARFPRRVRFITPHGNGHVQSKESPKKRSGSNGARAALRKPKPRVGLQLDPRRTRPLRVEAYQRETFPAFYVRAEMLRRCRIYRKGQRNETSLSRVGWNS